MDGRTSGHSRKMKVLHCSHIIEYVAGGSRFCVNVMARATITQEGKGFRSKVEKGRGEGG